MIFKLFLLTLTFLASTSFADSSIDITSEKLVMLKSDKTATFSTNVKAIYRNLVLTGDKLVISYSKNTENKTAVDKVQAFGNVKLTQGDDFVTSDYAEYTIGQDNIIFKKNVVMHKGESIVKGEHLIVNQKTKNAKLLSNETKKRVRAVYYTEQ